MAVPVNHAIQWRAFIGPRWHPDTHAAFYDWSTINVGEASVVDTFTKGLVQVDLAAGASSLESNINPGVSGYPTKGGLFIAPNGTGQVWDYVEYTGIQSFEFTGLTWEEIDGEFGSAHSAGAEFWFWYPLDTVRATIRVQEREVGNLSALEWTATIEGHTAPQVALRNRHLCVVEYRTADFSTGAWGSWLTAFVGWLRKPNYSDTWEKERPWRVEVVSIAGILSEVEADGVKVGASQVGGDPSVNASSTLTATYKEIGTGEFNGAEPDIAPANVVDQRTLPPWIDERYVGYPNTPANTADSAHSSSRGFSQVHVSDYPGQSPGYNWIEIALFATTSVADWIVTHADDGFDYFINMEVFGLSGVAEDRFVITENPTLFLEENPDHDAAQVVDAADIGMWAAQSARYELSMTGNPQSGSFKIQHSDSLNDSLEIFESATAQDVFDALQNIQNLGDIRTQGGPLPGTNVEVIWEKDSGGTPWAILGTFSIQPGSETGDFNNGATVNFSQTVASTLRFDTNRTSEEFFDYLTEAGGELALYTPVTGVHQAAVQWGTGIKPDIGSLWSGANVAAPQNGETLWYDYNTAGASIPADWWRTDNVHTPGYNPNGTRWVMITVPSMGLRLTSDISAGATTVPVSNAGGPNTDGLPASGTVQIGNDQIAYTGKSDTELTGASGVDSAHTEGDPIYFVDGTVAVDAFPISSLVLKRETGTPVLQDFVVRGSQYRTARDPKNPNYTADWTVLDSPTGNAASEYTVTLSPAKRYKHILVEITKMGTQPYRAMLNEVEIVYDTTVLDSDEYIDNVTVGEAMVQLLRNAGIPSGAISDVTAAEGMPDVTDYTTARDFVWPTLTELAQFGSVMCNVRRDSKIDLYKHPLWTLAQGIFVSVLEETQLDRDNVGHWETNQQVGAVAQVELTWRTPASDETQTVVHPDPADEYGRVVRAGPVVVADETAAAALAFRLYLQMRRPYDVSWDIVGEGRAFRPARVAGSTWQVDDDQNAQDRTYWITTADHELSDHWATVAHGIQVSRNNEL